MLLYIVVAILAIVAALLLAIAMRPAAFRIERASQVDAPPQAVLDLIEDFKQWKRWSPWEKTDPTQQVTLSGAPRGKGAVYEWVGKKNGEGRMEIVDVQPGEAVGIQLDFIKPFPSSNRCEFVVVPSGNGSRVAWIMSGQNTFMGKAFDLFMNMDRTLGRDFEKGLADMKTAAESGARQPGGSLGTPGAPGASSASTRV